MRKKVIIVGGGACALMLGAELDPEKFDVEICEQNAALGRKFLVAGDGGLNLTHSEPLEDLKKRYTPGFFLEHALSYFSNNDLTDWLRERGVATFTGTSGRIFPERGTKPITVLKKLTGLLDINNVKINYRHLWTGFTPDGDLIFTNENGTRQLHPDITVFCLGGASWPVTGSRGDWTDRFADLGIRINDFQPSNCAYKISWPPALIPKIEGMALKNVVLSCGKMSHAGEVILTRTGMEGSGIYPLSPALRAALAENGAARIFIDLKPALSLIEIEKRSSRSGLNITERLKDELNLSVSAVHLLKSLLSREQFLDTGALARSVKGLQIMVTGTGAIEDAISTVGGIDLTEVDENFGLKKIKRTFAIGEMLDYDAPTGGYLLQSCFSMGYYLAHHLNKIAG